MADNNPESVCGNICNASHPRPGDFPRRLLVLECGCGAFFQAYWQHPNRRISSKHCARPLIGEVAGKPSSRELGSPKRSSTLIPSSMIKRIIFVHLSIVFDNQGINTAAWLHRVSRIIEYQMGFIIIWSRRGGGIDSRDRRLMFDEMSPTPTTKSQSMQQFQTSI